MWTKMVDNFEDANPHWICSLFPTVCEKYLFKFLEIPVKIQLADFRLFYLFYSLLMNNAW
jgi:CRISPR/Cas system CSM-associated protein Csm4 (group 5 of RAMP superfamily)